MSDLFSNDNYKHIDILSLAAIKVHSLPDGWHFVKSEAVKGGYILAGNVFAKSGATKLPLEKVIITRQDLENIRISWEAQHYKCFECQGTGKELCGHSSVSGNMYRTCSKCDGDGRPRRIANC